MRVAYTPKVEVAYLGPPSSYTHQVIVHRLSSTLALFASGMSR